MNDLNESYVIGRAVDDVKILEYGERIKYFFIVAVNYYSMKKQQSYSDFIPVSFWKSKPSKELESIKKGDNIVVNGRISINSYEKDGVKRMATELVANYIKVFKLNKDTNDLDDLVTLIKSNEQLLNAIISSNETQFSESLMEKMMA
jgi:single-stranded DNA-binding protein